MQHVTYTGPAGSLRAGNKVYQKGVPREVSDEDAAVARRTARAGRITIEGAATDQGEQDEHEGQEQWVTAQN